MEKLLGGSRRNGTQTSRGRGGGHQKPAAAPPDVKVSGSRNSRSLHLELPSTPRGVPVCSGTQQGRRMRSGTAGDFSGVSGGNHSVAEFNILMVQRWNFYRLLAGVRSGVPAEGKVRLEMATSIHLHLSISIRVLGTRQQQVRDRHRDFPLFDLHVPP